MSDPFVPQTIEFVQFHDDQIVAVTLNGEHYVAVKPISDALGLNWSGQLQRIKRDQILDEAVVIMHMPFLGEGQKVACLPLRFMNGWLFGVETRKIKPECLDRLLSYKRECYDVLFRHFRHEGVTAKPAVPAERTEQEKIELVRLAISACRSRAGCEAWVKMGLPDLPAINAVLSQVQFSFLVDLGPSDYGAEHG